MTQIRIDTAFVQETARRLLASADRVSDLNQEIQQVIGSLDTWAWDGVSRSRAEPMLSRVRPMGDDLARELYTLGQLLERVVNVFEREDSTAAGHLTGMPWVDFGDRAGRVLGAATVAGAGPAVILASASPAAVPDISGMSWAERLAYADRLPEEIRALQAQAAEIEGQIDQAEGEIVEIDRRIAELEAQRDALEEEAAKLGNRLLPDEEGLEWGFDDGLIDAPWRTRSDAAEDQIDAYNEEIARLQAQRQGLADQRNAYQQDLTAVNQQLDTLHQVQTEVNDTLEKGIEFDGPSDIHPDFPGTVKSNCTKYASSRRDVPCRRDAHLWDNEARNAGYEVGDVPVSGSVMVMEAGVKGADATRGHVAIIERVERQGDGSYKIWYTDNGNNDVANPSTRTIVPGEEEISFIYDKMPASTV
jgi:surface antigen